MYILTTTALVCTQKGHHSKRDGKYIHWLTTNMKTKHHGYLNVHLSHEIKLNANLMQLCNLIDVFFARHVSGIYAHHQEH